MLDRKRDIVELTEKMMGIKLLTYQKVLIKLMMNFGKPVVFYNKDPLITLGTKWYSSCDETIKG